MNGEGKKDIKLTFEKRLDRTIGKFICAALGFSRRRRFRRALSIAVIKLSSIGDSALLLPALKMLKEKTHANISVICTKENHVIFEKQQHIDEIIVYNARRLGSNRALFSRQFDLAIDAGQSGYLSAIIARRIAKASIGIHNEFTPRRNSVYDQCVHFHPRKHTVKNYFMLILPLVSSREMPPPRLLPPWHSQKDALRVRCLLPSPSKQYIGLHATNTLPSKQWPLKKFASLMVRLLEEYRRPLVLVGAPQEKFLAKRLLSFVPLPYRPHITNLVGKTTLRETLALFNYFSLFIANDGGPMHLAAAAGVPTVGIFGYETPLRYSPYSPESIALYKGSNERPLSDVYKHSLAICHRPKHLEAITVEEVLAAGEMVTRGDKSLKGRATRRQYEQKTA